MIITCARHGRPVKLADMAISHEDGQYCDSRDFVKAVLSRDQVMLLLVLAKGLSMVEGEHGMGEVSLLPQGAQADRREAGEAPEVGRDQDGQVPGERPAG